MKAGEGYLHGHNRRAKEPTISALPFTLLGSLEIQGAEISRKSVRQIRSQLINVPLVIMYGHKSTAVLYKHHTSGPILTKHMKTLQHPLPPALLLF